MNPVDFYSFHKHYHVNIACGMNNFDWIFVFENVTFLFSDVVLYRRVDQISVNSHRPSQSMFLWRGLSANSPTLTILTNFPSTYSAISIKYIKPSDHIVTNCRMRNLLLHSWASQQMNTFLSHTDSIWDFQQKVRRVADKVLTTEKTVQKCNAKGRGEDFEIMQFMNVPKWDENKVNHQCFNH